MEINLNVTLAFIMCITFCDVVSGNATSFVNEENMLPKKEITTIKNLTPGNVSYSSEHRVHVDGFTTARHRPLHGNHSDSLVTGETLPWDENGLSNGTLHATNSFANTDTIAGSVYLNLNILDCNDQFHRYQVTGSHGIIFIFFTPTSETQNIDRLLTCNVELKVPPGMVAHVQTVSKSSWNVIGSRGILLDEDNNVLFSDSPRLWPPEFITYSSSMNIQVQMFMFSNAFNLHLNFSAIAEIARSQMYANFTSRTTGYLEISQVWQNRGYLPFINTWTHLTAPDDFAVIVNIYAVNNNDKCTRISARSDLLIFHTDNNSTVTNLCLLDRYSFTDPLIHSGAVYVQYKSYNSFDQTNFRIMFSFHRLSALPVKLSEDRWNCSGVHWPDMQQHFPCNFLSECVGGEDEAGCWPGSDTCSPGTFQADGRCFSIVRLGEKESSWNLASRWCLERGGLLPSLSTRTVWDTVTEVFMATKEAGFVFIGAKATPPVISPMYQKSWVWSDGTIAHFIKTMTQFSVNLNIKQCTSLSRMYGKLVHRPVPLDVERCDELSTIRCLLCEVPGASNPYRQHQPPKVQAEKYAPSLLSTSAYVRCPANHFTHVFLACDEFSTCWSNKDGATASCSAPLTSVPSQFKCASLQQSVQYTLVCNHRDDCRDGSDEDFCNFPPCDVTSFRCSGRKCVQPWERCDGQVDCDDRTDEDQCPAGYDFMHSTLDFQLPLKIDLGSKGAFVFSPYREINCNSSSIFSCPDSHFTCASLQKVCLPVYFRCNGLNDCPGHEDETECDSYTCPGFYRCRGFQVCIHESQLCDGVYQCPQRDDEMLCNETCPHTCVCHGWAFVCSGIFQATNYSYLRFLDLKGTSMTLDDLENNSFLVHLSLVHCNLSQLHEVTLPNLRILDLSNNELTHIHSKHFAGLSNLDFLNISSNPLKVLGFTTTLQSSPLKSLDMSYIPIPEMDFHMLAFFSSLRTLNLTGSQLSHVTGEGFPPMSGMRILDLRLSPITAFPSGIFKNLTRLKTIFADNYKLCCPVTLPSGFNVRNCHAPSDEVSSCDDLLRSNLYRVGLAIFASLAVLGNLSSLVYRLIFHRTRSNVGYDVFVTNLCLSDFLMGVFLFIIGIADHVYKGTYLWEDVGWRNSGFCKMAGFLCLLSTEVSVFIIFFITCDRFLVIRFPFSPLRFGKRSAQCACAVSWLTGLSLAVVPLLPVTSHWQFYSQTSICIPLPTSRKYFPGQKYSFGIIIILNFIFFLFIFIGQIFIYVSVSANSMSAASTSKTVKEFNIARRLISVVMSDFFCWFPVGLTGILASRDVPISGEVSVAMAIFVLPTNAALNPFLYTINIYLERRRRTREEQRRKWIIAQLISASGCNATGNHKFTLARNEALNLIRTLLSVNSFSRKELRSIIEDAR